MSKKKNFVTQEKVADTNIKADFFGDNIESKIMEEAFRNLPTLKDENYNLIITNKDEQSGNLIGRIEILIPQRKNPNGNIKLYLPVFINDFKLKPIDTFVLDKAAFPATEDTIKELLLDPETFRPLTMREIKETRVLAKLATDFYENTTDELKKLATEETDLGKYASFYLHGIEKFFVMNKEADNFNEPITDCIIEKDKNFNFNVYYVKLASDNSIKFEKEALDSAGVRVLMESMGYNSEKLANELVSKKQINLKSPAVTDGKVNSFPYNPEDIKKTKLFSVVQNGPAKVLDLKGNELTGYAYDIFSFSSSIQNNMPKGKIFIDQTKNFYIGADMQGIPNETDKMLSEDKPESGTMAVFLDPQSQITFGPFKVLSTVSNPNTDEMMTINSEGRKFKVSFVDDLQKYINDADNLMIPKHYQFIKLNKRINLYDVKSDEMINAKIAEMSYTVKIASGDIKITKFIGDRVNDVSSPLRVPSINHLKLLLLKLNLLSTDLDKVINEISKGKPLTFSSNFPLLGPKIPLKTEYEHRAEIPQDTAIKIVKIIKTNNDPSFFPKLFSIASKQASFEKEMDEITKEGGTNDSLDTLFSLNLINDVNSSVFLQNIDKLKFTLSYLSALRIYLRYGWDIGIKEADINAAVESLSNIVNSLQLLKAKMLLDKQLSMQNG